MLTVLRDAVSITLTATAEILDTVAHWVSPDLHGDPHAERRLSLVDQLEGM